MVEQRDVAVRELRVEECDECHVGAIIGAKRRMALKNGIYSWARLKTRWQHRSKAGESSRKQAGRQDKKGPSVLI
jgi:hypothetical protein